MRTTKFWHATIFLAVLRIHDILVWIRIRGSADPCLRLMDPDPAIFVIDLQDANKKTNLKKKFSFLNSTFT
jgi:hypothetical protein